MGIIKNLLMKINALSTLSLTLQSVYKKRLCIISMNQKIISSVKYYSLEIEPKFKRGDLICV